MTTTRCRTTPRATSPLPFPFPSRTPEDLDAEDAVLGVGQRAGERTCALTALLHARPDLTGVHAPADCAVAHVLGGV